MHVFFFIVHFFCHIYRAYIYTWSDSSSEQVISMVVSSCWFHSANIFRQNKLLHRIFCVFGFFLLRKEWRYQNVLLIREKSNRSMKMINIFVFRAELQEAEMHHWWCMWLLQNLVHTLLPPTHWGGKISHIPVLPYLGAQSFSFQEIINAPQQMKVEMKVNFNWN